MTELSVLAAVLFALALMSLSGCGPLGRNEDTEIYVIAADGSHQRGLTHNAAQEYNPTWSPDGRQIAFVSGKSLRRE